MASWRLARVAAVPSLEVPGTQDGKEFSRRWIMIHMMEEYARHCGHADPAPGADPRSGRGVSTAGDGAAAYPGVGKMPPSMPSAQANQGKSYGNAWSKLQVGMVDADLTSVSRLARREVISRFRVTLAASRGCRPVVRVGSSVCESTSDTGG